MPKDGKMVIAPILKNKEETTQQNSEAATLVAMTGWLFCTHLIPSIAWRGDIAFSQYQCMHRSALHIILFLWLSSHLLRFIIIDMIIMEARNSRNIAVRGLATAAVMDHGVARDDDWLVCILFHIPQHMVGVVSMIPRFCILVFPQHGVMGLYL